MEKANKIIMVNGLGLEKESVSKTIELIIYYKLTYIFPTIIFFLLISLRFTILLSGRIKSILEL